jgi:predicted DCC family thiol-disulfide oxidoreductase YuxK
METAFNRSPRDARVLIYDGECRFCLAAKDRLARRHSDVRCIPYQSAEAVSRLGPAYQPGRPAVAYLVEPDGRVHRGLDAFVALLSSSRMGRLLRRLLEVPGLSGLAYGAYRFVAQHRYAWFGAVQPCGEHCTIHGPSAGHSKEGL